jgi:hypothetical protein
LTTTRRLAIGRTAVAIGAVLVIACAAVIAVAYLSPTSPGVPSLTSGSDGSGCPSNAICGSFTYAPAGQVRVDSVQATQSVCQGCGAVNGTSYVSFAVVFYNTGDSPVYVFTSSAGIDTSVPSNSVVLEKVPSSAFCLGTVAIMKIEPGGNLTLSGPTYCTGFYYQLVGKGIVDVGFDFQWNTNDRGIDNMTTISAQFNFQ